MDERQLLSGWGNYPRQMCDVTVAHREQVLRQALLGDHRDGAIMRGLGRSYGDSALNAGGRVVIDTPLNRFRAFDPESGLLECEAGASLAEIIEHLLPRGWFPPTTPGTRYVTVGGAIAADVHGKNHHVDGSFGNFVRELKLLLADGNVATCSPQENERLFWATVGGMGLTGCILSAKLQLLKVESSSIDVRYERTASLDETLERFTAHDRDYRYSVAWIDCLRGGPSLGRSVLMLGEHARAADLPAKQSSNPLRVPALSQWRSVPCYAPGWLLNRWSVAAFNTAYYETHRDGRALVPFGQFFYPLDRLARWNRLYGRRGFVQYQALFPRETSRAGLIELLEQVVSSKRASFLAVLKACGPANPGLLSYLYPGHTLALDFANTGDDLLPFLRMLDEIVLKHGGRLYLAKDAATTADAFATMYPKLVEFRRIKAEVDPQCRFVSSQARRLKIVEGP